jgi:hypothetical protein
VKATTPASLIAGALKLTNAGELRAISTAPAVSIRTMDESNPSPRRFKHSRRARVKLSGAP